MKQDSYIDYYQHLQHLVDELKETVPEPMMGFDQLHRTALGDAALTKKTKELIALAIAISLRCDGCVAYHVRDALASGATREEIAEAIGVAVLMGGGPAVVYGALVNLGTILSDSGFSGSFILEVSSQGSLEEILNRAQRGRRYLRRISRCL